jgi:hypothetical protein
MATAELLPITTAWLQEGLRLKDMTTHLAGAAPVESYIEARNACHNLPWQRPGGRALTLTTEERRRSARREELHQACFAPLVGALNSGRIIAVRPDADISKFVRLLPPATGWRFRVFDLEKSLIFDPKRSAQLLFVLFMFADREPALAREPVEMVGPVEKADQQRTRSSKAWLTSAVQTIPLDDHKHGCKKRYAKKLAAKMAQDAKSDKSLKPSSWTSISARLTECELWPSAKQHDHDR